MKFLQIFNKTPNYKKFSYSPRFYDPLEEERRERESRIKKEIEEAKVSNDEIVEQYGHRQRIAGSFRQSKKTVSAQSDPSATMLRLIILLILTVGLIAFLQFGKNALYAVVLAFVPFYLYLKFRKFKRG
jgi:Flp pilus assembly protein TadB